MTNRWLMALLVIIVVGFVGIWASGSLRPQSSTSFPVETTQRTVPVTVPATESNSETLETGQYLLFSPETLASTANTRRVLFFYASWCPICRPADADFQKNVDRLPADVTLIRVNYNDDDTDQAEKDLAQQYGVTYQHTFVQIDGQGNEIAKWNGGQTNELLRNLR